MVTAQDVKHHAKKCGADLVGIASIDRFRGAPPEMHPASIFPEAESVIMVGMRILRGCLRGIEEGTYWPSYHFFGYDGLNRFYWEVCYETARFIENHGWEAVPNWPSSPYWEAGPRGPVGGPVAPGKLTPNIAPSFRFAAVAAGLGEIGYSKVFLSPQFGPRQRLGMIITDAQLEPDPLFDGEVCDRCMLCVKECPAGAISRNETVVINIGGKKCEWGKLDTGKCKLTHFGFNRLNSPFVAKDMPGFHLDVAKQDMTWLKAANFGWALAREVRYISMLAHNYGHWWPICGGRGCVRACYAHLEATGRLQSKFRNPFRKRKPWLLAP